MAAILQKYFIYDPGVRLGDELGRQRVRIEKEEDGVFFLATPQQAQWWIDQGLAGKEPLSKLSGAAKSLLKQVTRGRSENPDDLPRRVPKYDKRSQSGSPGFALKPASQRVKKGQKRNDRKAKTTAVKQRPPTPTPTA
jgi:hypothetical protein